MSEKPMRWAVEAGTVLHNSGHTFLREDVAAIQRAAEPILAVAQNAEVRDDDGVLIGCLHCARETNPDGPHRHANGEGEDGFVCPVPAALKAMETTK